MIRVSKTVEVVTPESAENADFDRGQSRFEYKGVALSFRELVRELENYSEPSCWPLTEAGARAMAPWVTSESDVDYRTGAETRYSLHLDDDRNPRMRRYWAKALRVAGLVQP